MAFIDRADIRAYIGPPNAQARYETIWIGCRRPVLCRPVSMLRNDLELIPQMRSTSSTPPSSMCRYAILHSCLAELDRAGIVCGAERLPGTHAEALRLGSVAGRGLLSMDVVNTVSSTSCFDTGASGDNFQEIGCARLVGSGYLLLVCHFAGVNSRPSRLTLPHSTAGPCSP